MAAAADRWPMTSPGSTQRGKNDGSRPASFSSGADQSPCAMSMAIIVPAAVRSIERSPHSRNESRPGIISHWVPSRVCGSCSRNQMSLSSVLKGMIW